MKTKQLDITHDGATETVTVRLFKLTERATRLDELRQGTKEGDAIPLAKFAKYQIGMVADSIVDGAGAPRFTRDEIDEWEPDKFLVYCRAIEAVQNPVLEDVAKNSTATTEKTI